MGVAVGGKNFDDTVTDLDDGYIEGTAAEVVYHDLLLFFVVKAVCKCCSGRLVDDTLYFQTCDLTCVLGCLTLCVVKVCGNRDNSLRYLLAEVTLSVCLQLLKNHCGDLLRRVLFVVNGAAVVGTHISLDGSDGLLSVGNCLTLCGLAYESLSCLGKCNDGRSGSCAFCICDNGGLTTFHNCYAAVCCT